LHFEVVFPKEITRCTNLQDNFKILIEIKGNKFIREIHAKQQQNIFPKENESFA